MQPAGGGGNGPPARDPLDLSELGRAAKEIEDVAAFGGQSGVMERKKDDFEADLMQMGCSDDVLPSTAIFQQLDPDRKKQKWEKFLEKQNETVRELQKQANNDGSKGEEKADNTN